MHYILKRRIVHLKIILNTKYNQLMLYQKRTQSSKRIVTLITGPRNEIKFKGILAYVHVYITHTNTNFSATGFIDKR